MLLTITLIREETWNDTVMGTEDEGGRTKEERRKEQRQVSRLTGRSWAYLLGIVENAMYSDDDQWSG